MRPAPLVSVLIVAGQMCFAGSPVRTHEQPGNGELAPGLFLVAPREPADDSFAETVVLLIQHDQNGTMGLVINRRTGIPISRVLEKEKATRRLSDLAYAGGPVQRDAVLALSRNAKKIDDAISILKDVYLISTKAELNQVLRGKPSTRNLRVYLGYTGWAPGQLEHELDLEVWRILPGDEDSVFDPDPGSVWPRLIERTEMRFAGLFRVPGSAEVRTITEHPADLRVRR